MTDIAILTPESCPRVLRVTGLHSEQMQHNDGSHTISPSDIGVTVNDLYDSLGQAVVTNTAWLRDEAKRVTTRLLAVHTLMNRLVPIHRLPDDVFMEILSYVAHTWSPPHMWFPVTHVCRRWREVALQCSSLWTTVNIHNDEHALACIERSGTRPIRIIWQSSDDEDELSFTLPQRFLDLTAPVAVSSRVEEVDIKALDVETLHADIVDFPNLRFLSLSHGESMSSADFVLADMHPDSFQRSSRLQTLKLSSVKIPWSSPLFSEHLRVLHISNWETAPFASELLLALQRCPALEELRIHDAGPQAVVEESQNLPIVQLPLQSLHITQYQKVPSFKTLLSHINCPSSTRFDISYDFSVQRVELYTQDIWNCIFDAVSPVIKYVAPTARLDVVVVPQTERHEISGYSQTDPMEDAKLDVSHCTPAWKMTLVNINPTGGFLHLIMGALGAALAGTSKGIRTLKLLQFECPYRSSSDWAKMFSPFEGVHSLTINFSKPWKPSNAWDRTEDSEGTRILEALSKDLPTGVLPHLRLLDLDDVEPSPPSSYAYMSAISQIRHRKRMGEKLCIRFDEHEVHLDL